MKNNQLEAIEELLLFYINRVESKLRECNDPYLELAEGSTDLYSRKDLMAEYISTEKSERKRYLDDQLQPIINRNIAFFKAKKHMEDGDIVDALQYLHIFTVLNTEIDLRLEFGERSKVKSDNALSVRHKENREKKEEFKIFLKEERPENGWEDKKIAIDEAMKHFYGTPDDESMGEWTATKNLYDNWLKIRKNEVHSVFVENASEKWREKYLKN